MASSVASTLDFISQEISIYFGIPLLLIGVVGGFLNLLVFLTLKTFRQNSCAFYLTIMSFVNILLLLTGLLSRITISGFGIDWTQDSVFYCKCRVYINQLSILLSLSCICLASIDQFISTKFSIPFYKRNNMKLARILVIIFVLIWILHGIPYLFYYNVVVSRTGQTSCSITNSTFQRYTSYGFLLFLSSILPLLVTIVFGLLAYRNVRQIVHRNLPIIRRELDKQLTIMVLVHLSFDLFTLLPYTIVSIMILNQSLLNNAVTQAYLQFARIITIYLYYLYFVVSLIFNVFFSSYNV